MAKHNNTEVYPFDNNITINDFLFGSDGDNRNATRNFSVVGLINLIETYIGNGGILPNGLISGNVIWMDNLDYHVSNLVYALNNQLVTSEATTVTIANGDSTFSRIDVIVADAHGNISILQGLPSANPVKPVVGYGFLELTFVLILANATVANGVSDVVIYSDNLNTDWLNDSSGLESINFDLTVEPYLGTKSIFIKEILNNASISFDSDSNPIVYDSSLNLSLFINLKQLVNTINRINVVLYDSDGNASSTVTIVGGNYGLDYDLADVYQSVVIPLSAFTRVTNIDRIVFFLSDALDAFLLIDHIRFVSGVVNPVLNNTYLNLSDTTDTDYVGKSGYSPTVENGALVLKPTVTIVLVNTRPFVLVKHPNNNDPLQQQTLQLNDYVINGIGWDGTELWFLAQLIANNGAQETDFNVIQSRGI